MLISLVIGMVTLAFNIQPVNASGSIYIKADGSVDPTSAPVSTSDKVTYSFTGSIDDSIVVERSNVLICGKGFMVKGSGNGTGIELRVVANVTIEDVYIANFQYGVYLRSGYNNSVLVSYLMDNQYGVFLNATSNSTISKNNVMNSTSCGIWLGPDSSGNVVSKNQITVNYCGIQIEQSWDNSICQNNFVNNAMQANIVAPSPGNVWDEGYPWCGNYWSNYNGTDVESGPYQNETGKDGVGDTAYAVGANCTDNYPLMNPWNSDFTVLDHMVVGYASSLTRLDPAHASSFTSAEVFANVYEPLIFFDGEKTDQFVPRLATSWEISPDGLNYTFRIRQDVKFHNNETLTPEDVEYSLERIFVINYATPGWLFYEAFFNCSNREDYTGFFNGSWQQIGDAITENGTCVQLHLISPYPPLMQILAQPWASILCKNWSVQIGDWPGTWDNWTAYSYPNTRRTAIDNQTSNPPGPHTNAMCGTGPYMFDYNQGGVEWQLIRFDDYWGGWPAKGSSRSLKRVTGKTITDWEKRKERFLDGQLDHLQVMDAATDEVLGQPGVRSIYPLQKLNCFSLFFSFDISTSSEYMGVPGGLPRGTLDESGIPPDFFTDVDLRKGFAYAFNYSQLITEALHGEASQPATPIVSGIPYRNPSQEKYGINLTRASGFFLSAWGGQLWSTGFNFTICYGNGNTLIQKAMQKTCEIVKANVESLNPRFHIQIRPVEWADYLNSMFDFSLPIFTYDWGYPEFVDPHDYAWAYMYSLGDFAYVQSYSDSTIDYLVWQGVSTTSEVVRNQTYYELQNLYFQDCPAIPLYQSLGWKFERNWVQGWCYNPLLDMGSSIINCFYVQWKEGINATRYPSSQFHHDATHTGYSESPPPRTNRVLWNYTTLAGVYSSPAIVDSRVYFGSLDGTIYCLDASTGLQVWNHTTGGAVCSSPAVVGGEVYVGSADCHLYCVDASTGAEIWNYTVGDVVYSSPVVEGGRVYLGPDDGTVYCFDAFTGAQIWNYTTGGHVSCSPAAVDGKIYVGCSPGGNATYLGAIYCFDAFTGAQIWNCTTGGSVFSSPAVVNDRVYVGSDDVVYCLDASTGVMVWNYTAEGLVESSPAIAEGRVYVGSDDNRTYCLDSMTGVQIWNYTMGDQVFSSPAIADGRVYLGSLDTRIYCLDASTGLQVWNYTTGDAVYSSPAIADCIAFVGSFDSSLYAFGDVVRSEEYNTVQEAINAAPPEGTVWIAPGTYNESLIINKTLTIFGRLGTEPGFRGGGSGIAITLLPNASGSIIAGIVVTSWERGIFVQNANGCRVYDNIITLVSSDAIVFEGTNATNNLVFGNFFLHNGVAINLMSLSANITVCNNIISLSDVGLKVESSGNIIYANIITENGVGISLKNSNDNRIYHNNFIGNNIQLSILASTGNVWDDGYPSGGNYWACHVSVDSFSGPNQDVEGSDGIADMSYTVATNNVDNYPLARPFSVHNIGISCSFKVKAIVGHSYTLKVEVKIVDFGMYDETFALTIYVNATVLSAQTISVALRSSFSLTVNLSIANLAKGNYTLCVVASVVAGETEIGDNTFSYGVTVTIPGDANGDGVVNILDAITLGRFFLTTPGSADWNPDADINCDNVVNILDAIVIGNHFLEHYP